MNGYKGPARLTFDDGSVTDGHIDMRFMATGGTMSGRGHFSTQEAMMLFGKKGTPILAYEDFRIRVHVAEANMEGVTLLTTGPPL